MNGGYYTRVGDAIASALKAGAILLVVVGLIVGISLGWLLAGCGASQDVSTGAGYAEIIASCDAREQHIEDSTMWREEAEEQLELVRADCAERKRAWREGHGVSGLETTDADE